MRKIISICLLLFSQFFRCEAQVIPTEYAYGGPNSDYGSAIIKTKDGGYAVAGYSDSYGTQGIYLLKLDSAFNLKWTKVIGRSEEDARSLIQTRDGGYALAGASDTWEYVNNIYTFEGGIYVVRLDSTGNIIWTKVSKGNQWGNSITQIKDGGFVVTGEAAGTYISTIKLDSLGQIKWASLIGGNEEAGYSVIPTNDDGCMITGYSNEYGSGGEDVYIVRLDSLGNTVFAKAIGGTSEDIGYSIIQTKDKGYVIAGSTNSFGITQTGVYLIKLDSAANLLWTKTYADSAGEFATSIVQTTDGGYAMGGFKATEPINFDAPYIYILKVDPWGNLKWTSTIDNGANLDIGPNVTNANSILQIKGGGYAVVGYTEFGLGGSNDVFVGVLDSLGNTCSGVPELPTNVSTGGVVSWGGSFPSGYNANVDSGGTVDSGGIESVVCTLKHDVSCALNLSANISSNVSCFGGNDGSALVIPAGGLPPYTYSWSNGGSNASKSGLSLGDYTVTVKDSNGCVGYCIVVITQPNILHVAVNVIGNVSCYGESNGVLSSNVIGGTSPYSYSWSGGRGSMDTISGLSPGSYTLSVTDNHGCTGSATATITQPNALSASANIIADVLCNGEKKGKASSKVGGGTSPYTYLWSNGAIDSVNSGLSAGAYTVRLTDNHGCTASASVTITQPAAITTIADYYGFTDSACMGVAYALANGGTSPYRYLWTNGGTDDTAKKLCEGHYCCVVTDRNGCKDSSCINTATGINNISPVMDRILVYPNPNSGIFTIQANNQQLLANSYIEIYNVLGEKVYSQSKINNSQLTINLNNQPNGVYLYRIITETGDLIGEGKIAIEK